MTSASHKTLGAVKILATSLALASFTALWQGCNKSTPPTEGGGAPTITTQPTAQTVNAGATLTLSVTATGDMPTYAWVHSYSWDDQEFVDTVSHSATFTRSMAAPIDAGNYKVVVKNAQGTAVSNSVAVTVTAGSLPAALMTAGATEFNACAG